MKTTGIFWMTAKERECVSQSVRIAEQAGYRNLADVIEEGGKLTAGDKVYSVNMNKSIALFQIGRQPLEKGMAILGAHIDSPPHGYKAKSIV